MENEDDWRYQIGELMVRFAEIESYVAGCLVSLPNNNIFEVHKRKMFKQKCLVAIKEIKQSSISDKTKDDLVSSIENALELAKYRNLIAHNPINLSLESMFEENMRYEIISYVDYDERVSLEEVKNIVRETQECSAKFEQALENAEIEIGA